MTRCFVLNLNHPNRSRRKAYSLIELLVAVAILGVIVLMMVAISNQATRAWLLGLGQNERRSNGRILLDFVARDLKAATLPTRSLVPSSSTAPQANLQFFVNISTPPDANTNPTSIPTADMNPHALFWQAPVAVNTTYGNIAEVGYFVKWDTTSRPGIALAQMCRFLVNPDPIDPTTGNTGTTSNFQIYNRNTTSGNPLNWISGPSGSASPTTDIDAVAPATAASNYQGWFADNVIAFWVRCLDSAGQPITLNATGAALPAYGFDSRQGYTDSAGVIHPAPALPAAVDLAIVTVDSATANRITAPLTVTVTTPADLFKDQTTSGSIDYFMNNLPANVKPGAQLFSTTVYIPSK